MRVCNLIICQSKLHILQSRSKQLFIQFIYWRGPSRPIFLKIHVERYRFCAIHQIQLVDWGGGHPIKQPGLHTCITDRNEKDGRCKFDQNALRSEIVSKSKLTAVIFLVFLCSLGVFLATFFSVVLLDAHNLFW